MSVKLRLTRMGRRHKPFFRLNAIESRNPRDGKIIEKLGHYDPIEKDPQKQLVLNKERIEYWLGAGAIPSDTVAEMITKIGIVSSHYQQSQEKRKRARILARKKGIVFDNTQRAQANKLAEQAETKQKTQTETEAKSEAKQKAEPKQKASE